MKIKTELGSNLYLAKSDIGNTYHILTKKGGYNYLYYEQKEDRIVIMECKGTLKIEITDEEITFERLKDTQDE